MENSLNFHQDKAIQKYLRSRAFLLQDKPQLPKEEPDPPLLLSIKEPELPEESPILSAEALTGETCSVPKSTWKRTLPTQKVWPIAETLGTCACPSSQYYHQQHWKQGSLGDQYNCQPVFGSGPSIEWETLVDNLSFHRTVIVESLQLSKILRKNAYRFGIFLLVKMLKFRKVLQFWNYKLISSLDFTKFIRSMSNLELNISWL